MDAFSFVFSLFGLLMGLALAEAIGGFGKALELRHKIHIGWLLPLLGLLITFDITAFWLVAWQHRAEIPVQFISLAAGLVDPESLPADEVLAVPDDAPYRFGLGEAVSPLRLRGMVAMLSRVKRQVRSKLAA